MTAVRQVVRAAVRAIARAGCAATEAYSEETLRRCEAAVAAVGTRCAQIEGAGMVTYLGLRTDEETQAVREVYGRKMTLTLSIDVFAPRTLGAAGCGEAAETVTLALAEALPEGLRLRALRWEETKWDKASGMFRRCAQAEYAAYFVAETAEDETVFTDFVLKGTVKEHDEYDP